jgi:hypothetical protein
MAYNFNDETKKKIDIFLNSLKKDLYDTSIELEIGDVMFGPCQCYIVRFNYQGIVFSNGYRNFDLIHICVKSDGSGLIDYIKIYPEKNLKTNVLMNAVRLTGCLFGVKIGKIDEGSDFGDRFIRLYVNSIC